MLLPFLLFFISGFCGLLYQVIWVRLAFASFGIITPVLSIVISVFMLGLALGSWLGGVCIGPMARKTGVSAIFWYGAVELLIGMGAFAVPKLFSLGGTVLLRTGESDSLAYLFLSALVIAISVFPWCLFMGATFPFMMAYIREGNNSNESFSFLYVANVIGAMAGTLMTAVVLIEVFGFCHSLWIAGGLNAFIATISLALGMWQHKVQLRERSEFFHAFEHRGELSPPPAASNQGIYSVLQASSLTYWILFTTGFTSLALEVVWTRAFTPVMGTQVYAFALLLFVYLLATWIGSLLYRSQRSGAPLNTAQLVALLAVFVFLPVIVNDPRLVSMNLRNMDPRINPVTTHVLGVLLSIFPFCVVLGYLTPQLIDRFSEGDPRRAGSAYALNIVGCILGPLAASYLLLPSLGARYSMVVLALPFLIFYLIYCRPLGAMRWLAGTVSAVFLYLSVFVNVSYEAPRSQAEDYIVRRDHTATVISDGKGMERGLSINGVVITIMTPITKFMAHLPLAFHRGRPESALVICFGMGTTYRSLLSWEIQATAVELVPSVKDAFSYYFEDATTVLGNPKGRIVIDDGRRFLRRTDQTFDVITIDPAPPAEAAGSSLLYSEQFYSLVKGRLKPDGILQQWFAVGEKKIQQAVVRSLVNSFPYVRAYPSVAGWGYHFLASMSPIGALTAEEMAQRLPERARDDLLEWSQGRGLKEYLDSVLSREIPIQRLLSPDLQVRITDDRPFNEYFLLRRAGFWR